MEKEYEIKEKIYHKSQEQTIFSAEYYTILFILSGKCFCHYENHEQLCTTEDMILIKPGYKAVLSYSHGKTPLRLFRLVFSEPLLLRLSNAQTDLKASFRIAPFPCTCVHISSDAAMMLKHISNRLLSSTKEQNTFAQQLFQDSLLTMLLVLTLRSCIKEDKVSRKKIRSRLSLDDIFMYIHLHLHEEITLDMLEKEFFISKYHIAREFKKQTNITVHKYITKSRLDLCRTLLEEGYPITEIYKVCGFGSYNHLFRAFKQEFGMTPKEYLRKKREAAGIPPTDPLS